MDLAKLSAKLLNEGTKSDGAVEFSKKLEDRAIDLSVNSGNETFVVELNSLRSEFDYGVKLLEKLLNNPNYTKDTMSNNKNSNSRGVKDEKRAILIISHI